LHASQKGLLVDYRALSTEQLARQQPASFDIVACMEVLEHVPRPQAVVRACARLLKPGGQAFFSTIDRSLKSLLFVILGAEYILRLLPIGSHTYRALIRPDELLLWARENGLQFVRHAGVSYNLLARKFSLVPGLDVNYMMHFTKN